MALSGKQATSPPQPSARIPCVESCCFTRSMASWRKPTLSAFVIATTIGTSAAFAWSIASTVCGMTPSSAATTRTATSVTCAPRRRISVKASWPGVSRNVIRRPSGSATWYAPMCCVIPPASWAATSEWRIQSRRLVLPWSTWPMTTTTGGLDFRSSGLPSPAASLR